MIRVQGLPNVANSLIMISEYLGVIMTAGPR